MSRRPDSGQLNLAEVFHRVQKEMLAQLAVGRLFEHASSAGAATEHHWLALFNRYLPKRYRSAPTFVIDSAGRRSRQIDIAIFDNLYSPLLFPHANGLHVGAESIYAVFEVKPTISKRKAIKPSPILAGLLATSSVWTPETFSKNLRPALTALPPAHRLDLGCSLDHGSFERSGNSIRVSPRDQSLIFFLIRLMDRLRAMGTAPAADLMRYGRFRP
jgi:hypothetical protein